MRVTWITKDDAPAIVEYGTSSGQYPFSATGSTTTYSYVLYHSGKIHDAVIGPLRPSTTYYYRCSSSSSREFSLRTPPATLPINFVVVGKRRIMCHVRVQAQLASIMACVLMGMAIMASIAMLLQVTLGRRDGQLPR
jgi:hypothetical protein